MSYLICPKIWIITPSASPCAKAGWMIPAVPVFPTTDAQPTNTNKPVPNSSARQGCTYRSKMLLFLFVLVSFSAAGSPTSVTVKTSVLVSAPDMLTCNQKETLSTSTEMFHWWTTAYDEVLWCGHARGHVYKTFLEVIGRTHIPVFFSSDAPPSCDCFYSQDSSQSIMWSS